MDPGVPMPCPLMVGEKPAKGSIFPVKVAIFNGFVIPAIVPMVFTVLKSGNPFILS